MVGGFSPCCVELLHIGGDFQKCAAALIAVATLDSSHGEPEAGTTREGPWALFRLLDDSEMKASEQRDLFVVIFQSGGFRAIYEMRASSVANPFRLKALQNFRCPSSL